MGVLVGQVVRIVRVFWVNWVVRVIRAKKLGKKWVNWRIFYEVITQLLRDYFVQKVGMN